MTGVPGYEARVRELEAQGMSRSDAQAVADAQEKAHDPKCVHDWHTPGGRRIQPTHCWKCGVVK